MRAKIFSLLCCAIVWSGSVYGETPPVHDYIVDCVRDDAISPERIITACRNGIALRRTEGWGWPSFPEAYFNMGVAQERAGKYKDAESSFVELIKHEPAVPAAWRHFAADSAKLGNSPDIPMQLLDTLVQKAPKSAYIMQAACLVRGMLNQQLDVALADCDEAVNLAPDDAWGYFTRCLVRYRKGDFSLAIADCDEAVRRDPKTADALFIRGLVTMNMGHADLANADIAKAKSINPEIADYYAPYGVKP